MPTTTGKKIAIVTGSALGLGYELASQLIANGWLVAGVDFNAERQAELTAQWPDDSYRAYVGDITDEAFVKESVADIATLGHIDLLINNAGLGGQKRVVDMSDEEWSRVLDITLTGTFRMTRAMLPAMQARAV